MIEEIIEGHVNELLKRNQDIADYRFSICDKCPIKKTTALGLTCSKNLWINPYTDEVLPHPKPGYYEGCGCRIHAKTTLLYEHCPANKW